MKNTSPTFKTAAVLSSVLLAGTYVSFRAGLLKFGGAKEGVKAAEAPSAVPAATVASSPVSSPERMMLPGSKTSVGIAPMTPAQWEALDRSLNFPQRTRVVVPITPTQAQPMSFVEKQPVRVVPAVKKPEAPPRAMLFSSKSGPVDLTPPQSQAPAKPRPPPNSPPPDQQQVQQPRPMFSGSKSGAIFVPQK